MINFKTLIISILIPNVIGFLGSLLGSPMKNFDTIIKPFFTPPEIVFPIVWIILFTLMGVSSYLIFESKSPYKKTALTIYGIQLILNSLWNLFFFNLKWFLFSFILVLVIIILVIIMIYYFEKINKTAAILQVPYLLWLIFASILTFNIYLLN